MNFPKKTDVSVNESVYSVFCCCMIGIWTITDDHCTNVVFSRQRLLEVGMSRSSETGRSPGGRPGA